MGVHSKNCVSPRNQAACSHQGISRMGQWALRDSYNGQTRRLGSSQSLLESRPLSLSHSKAEEVFVWKISPVRVTIPVTKHHDQSSLWRKGVFWFTPPHQGRKSGQELKQCRNPRQELMPRPYRNASYWLAPHGFLNLLSYRTQDHQPRGDPTYDGLGPPPSIPHQWPIKKLPYRPV